MTAAAAKRPQLMTVPEFLAWPGDGTGLRYELVDGVLRAQDAASDAHGTVQSNLTRLIGNHLIAKRPGCRIVSNPGVQPRLRASWNYRIPDLGVTCTPNRPDSHMIPDPLLLIEVLSPTNEDDTWSNIALYASVPTVTEILVVDSAMIVVQLLRRGADGSWPHNPETIGPGGTIELSAIGLGIPISEVYRDTHLDTGRAT